MTRSQLFDQPSFIPIFEDYSHFKGQCIGLTGQRGVLGGILRERLSKYEIQVEAYPGDIRDDRSLTAWFKEHHFAYFFHFAAVVAVSEVEKNPIVAYETNTNGSYNICKQIIATQPNCWLFLASSSHVYKPIGSVGGQRLKVGSVEEPNTFYGVSKLAGERISRPILEKYDVAHCIGRIFSFSSITQKEPYLVPTLRRKIERLPDNGVLEVINPNSERDIMDAEAVIDCILHLSQKRFRGTLNIGFGKGMTVENIARQVAKALKKRLQIHGHNESQSTFLVADVQNLKKILSK